MRTRSWLFVASVTLACYFSQICVSQSTVRPSTSSSSEAAPYVLRGVPYSATRITTETRQTPDGNTITITHKCLEWRDAQGRTREEEIRDRPGGSVLRIINVNDPVAHIHYSWNAGNDLERSAIFTRIPGSTRDSASRQDAPVVQRASHSRTAHPATLGPSSDPESSGRVHQLGMMYMEDLYVIGTRVIRMIPAGTDAYKDDVTIVSETWTSPDLKIIVRSFHDDPRTGKTTLERTNIDRANPDEQLFRPPAGYRLQDAATAAFPRAAASAH